MGFAIESGFDSGGLFRQDELRASQDRRFVKVCFNTDHVNVDDVAVRAGRFRGGSICKIEWSSDFARSNKPIQWYKKLPAFALPQYIAEYLNIGRFADRPKTNYLT